MREHMGLYRGKRTDNGEWVYGFYVRADHHWHNHGIHKEWIICGASANGGWFALRDKRPVKSDSIGECTGLRDKNGKLIFENHKLKSDGEVYEVRMDCGEWRMFDKTDHYCELYIYAGNSEIVSEG